MFGIIKWFIVTIFNLLPDSPFSNMLDMMEVDSSYLQYLNWFLPFDYIGNIMLAWIDCMVAYFIFLLIKWIIFNVILSKITSIGKIGDLIGGGSG